MSNIKIEIQYFKNCPNSKTIIKTVKEFILQSNFKINFNEVLVETQAVAEKYKFRGSPTILLNGNDIEGLEENKTPSLACRYYQNGLPTKEDINRYINSLIKN